MTTADLEAIVARLSYRPGTSFSCDARAREVRVRLHVVARDVEGEGHTKFAPCVRIPLHELQWMDEKGALAAVVRLVASWELHEAAEWLRVDSRTVVDPHPEVLGGNPNTLIPYEGSVFLRPTASCTQGASHGRRGYDPDPS